MSLLSDAQVDKGLKFANKEKKLSKILRLDAPTGALTISQPTIVEQVKVSHRIKPLT
jgi:hypothetical protein